MIPKVGVANNDEARNIVNLLVEHANEFDGERLLIQTHNLFDKNQAGTGSVNNNTGLINDDGFGNTGYIKVEPGAYYTVKPGLGTSAFYDADMNYISGMTSTAPNPFQVPTNAHYFRGSYSSSDLDNYMIYKGTDDKPYVEYGFEPAPELFDQNFLDEVNDAKAYFETVDGVEINRGKDFPLKSVSIKDLEPQAISPDAKKAILDAKVFGAKPGHYYRIAFIGNGFVTKNAPRYGLSMGEYRIKDGVRTRFIMLYNDDTKVENLSNFNYQPTSMGIDTIIVDNGEFVVSVTVDRAYVSSTSSPDFVNLNTGVFKGETAVIDPVNYFF